MYSSGPRKLSPKQDLFCREYIKDLNGAQAAIRAGYSEVSSRVTAVNLLALDKVKERIAELLKPKHKKLDISADRVLEEIAGIAYSSVEETRDRLKALELLGKYQRLFADRLDIGKIPDSILVEEAQRRLNEGAE